MKRIKIDNKIYLNNIQEDKFKSNLLVLYLERPFDREEVTKNALLSEVLPRGSSNYESNIEIQRKLEELFGAKFNASIVGRGNKQIIRFAMQFVKPELVEEKEYLTEICNLFFDLIFNPKISDEKFDESYIVQEKENLKNRLIDIINDKRSFAIQEMISNMCPEESFSIPNYGFLEDIDEIDNKDLYLHYKEIIKTSPIEIFYIGKDFTDIKDIIDSYNIPRGNVIDIPEETLKKEVKNVRKIEKTMDINQGKLVLGYRTKTTFDDELYNALLVGNIILGGTSNSKLFLNVREKESLAYYIISRLYRYNGVLIIDAGINFDDYDKTIGIIENEVKNMKIGNIKDEEIEIAKSAIISSYKAITDSIGALAENQFNNLISKDERSIKEKINDIKNISKEDIIKAMNRIELDTIYFLRG